jgi:intergrase/recombinase
MAWATGARSACASRGLSAMASASPRGQKSQVAAIVAEVEKDNASIDTSIAQEDLMSAVETAKKVQTRIYHAQLILAGQKIK